ncbi:hypothetical protein HI914_03167 [Erysiphe necator]|nr:hypothetical protein HI914_03167 [Erysiphe necator]
MANRRVCLGLDPNAHRLTASQIYEARAKTRESFIIPAAKIVVTWARSTGPKIDLLDYQANSCSQVGSPTPGVNSDPMDKS